MLKIQTQIVVVMVLGFLSLVAGFFSHLALTDIYHGELNVSREWQMVQVAAFTILLFIGSSLLTLWRTLRILEKHKT